MEDVTNIEAMTDLADFYDGIKFYGAADMSCGYHLKEAEAILQSFNETDDYNDVNKVIELYNIKLYITNDLKLDTWSSADITKYKGTVKKFEKPIAVYFSHVCSSNLDDILSGLDINYLDDFWHLIDYYQAF